MSKEYKIEMIGDLLDLDERQFSDFLVDLKAMHEASRPMHVLMNSLGDERKGRDRVKEMTWIDDGEHKQELNLKLDIEQ